MSDFPVFRYPLLVRESHLDTFGHVNNATYLQLLEEARWELCTANGYGLDVVRATGLGPTILEIDIRFMRELRVRTPVTICTQLESYKGKVGYLNQWFESEGGVRHAEARLTFALFDMQARRLRLPTPEFLRAVGADSLIGS